MSRQEWMARSQLVIARMLLLLMRRSESPALRNAYPDFRSEVQGLRSEYEEVFGQKLGTPRDLDVNA